LYGQSKAFGCNGLPAVDDWIEMGKVRRDELNLFVPDIDGSSLFETKWRIRKAVKVCPNQDISQKLGQKLEFSI